MEVTQPTLATTAVKRNLFSSEEEEEESLGKVNCFFYKIPKSLKYFQKLNGLNQERRFLASSLFLNTCYFYFFYFWYHLQIQLPV